MVSPQGSGVSWLLFLLLSLYSHSTPLLLCPFEPKFIHNVRGTSGGLSEVISRPYRLSETPFLILRDNGDFSCCYLQKTRRSSQTHTADMPRLAFLKLSCYYVSELYSWDVWNALFAGIMVKAQVSIPLFSLLEPISDIDLWEIHLLKVLYLYLYVLFMDELVWVIGQEVVSNDYSYLVRQK